MFQLRIKVTIRRRVLRRTRACIRSIPEVPHESFVSRLQCKIRKRKYFHTNYL